ncbi:MAG: type transporter [Gemmatimonadales bacterium]|jgi:ABC-2 type transport system permease protein|nr:type transporter [Gemmatimonadales bacterium]
MREAWALIRSTWLTAASYRMAMLVSLFGLILVVLPIYFVANALQQTMQQTISAEAHQYFGFVVLGAVAFSLITSCCTALPGALDGAIGRGTFEVILGTPARISAICVGFMGYGVLWALLRGVILFGVAVLLGLSVVWKAVPLGVALLALTMLSYVGVGLLFAALILAFRTTGPLSSAVLTASMLLGGVYYPTQVIPSWIRDLGSVVPLTYGLRAIRQVVLRGDPLTAVARDVEILAAMTVLTLFSGIIAFSFALRHARRTGTLSSY